MARPTLTLGMATGRIDSPPKVGLPVISLNIDGKGERQFKVVKSDKQSDGTYLSELKGTKTGEMITLVDKPPAIRRRAVRPRCPNRRKRPNRRSRSRDRPTRWFPPPAAAAADPMKDAKEKEKEKRPILGRIFGDKDKTPAPAMPGPSAVPAAEPEKKPGLLGRVFGPKKPTGPSMPATGPVENPSPSAPPAVIPTPPGGVTGALASAVPRTGSPSRSSRRMMPTKPVPVAPPAPVVPTPAPRCCDPSSPTTTSCTFPRKDGLGQGDGLALGKYRQAKWLSSSGKRRICARRQGFFRLEVLKAKSAGAEAVFALPSPPDGMTIVKQMKELDFPILKRLSLFGRPIRRSGRRTLARTAIFSALAWVALCRALPQSGRGE